MVEVRLRWRMRGLGTLFCGLRGGMGRGEGQHHSSSHLS